MPTPNDVYIAYEFDAIEKAEAAARQARADPDAVIAGLLRLWRHCWREKTDRINGDQLGQFIAGADEKLRKALAVSFLELGDEHGDRVRGAERYLRIQASRVKGGHAAKGNLRRGTEPGKGVVQPGTSREAAGDQPEDPPGNSPGLTASSEQRTSSNSPLPPSTRGGTILKPTRRTRRVGHDPNDGLVRSTPPPPTWSPDTPAGAAFAARLNRLRDDGAVLAVTQLEQLVPRLDGEQLVIETHDAFFADYVSENYLPLLNGTGPPVELRCPTK